MPNVVKSGFGAWAGQIPFFVFFAHCPGHITGPTVTFSGKKTHIFSQESRNDETNVYGSKHSKNIKKHFCFLDLQWPRYALVSLCLCLHLLLLLWWSVDVDDDDPSSLCTVVYPHVTVRSPKSEVQRRLQTGQVTPVPGGGWTPAWRRWRFCRWS